MTCSLLATAYTHCSYAVDMLVCVALGVDMFDCVYPTRTAVDRQPPTRPCHPLQRLGVALLRSGTLNLRQREHAHDPAPLSRTCACPACARFTRAALHGLVAARAPAAAVLLTLHNVTFQLGFTRDMRRAVEAGAFPAFVHDFLHEHYAAQPCPRWVRDALQSVGITVDLPVVDTGDRGGAE